MKYSQSSSGGRAGYAGSPRDRLHSGPLREVLLEEGPVPVGLFGPGGVVGVPVMRLLELRVADHLVRMLLQAVDPIYDGGGGQGGRGVEAGLEGR